MKAQFESGKKKTFTTDVRLKLSSLLNRCSLMMVILKDCIYDVGAMLKMYFRELQPEPLMTFDLYEAFIAAMQEPKKVKN